MKKQVMIGQEKVAIDCGNPRYAASKAPSQIGLLIGQRTKSNQFTSEFAVSHNRAHSIDFNEDEAEHEPYVRK